MNAIRDDGRSTAQMDDLQSPKFSTGTQVELGREGDAPIAESVVEVSRDCEVVTQVECRPDLKRRLDRHVGNQRLERGRRTCIGLLVRLGGTVALFELDVDGPIGEFAFFPGESVYRVLNRRA